MMFSHFPPGHDSPGGGVGVYVPPIASQSALPLPVTVAATVTADITSNAPTTAVVVSTARLPRNGGEFLHRPDGAQLCPIGIEQEAQRP